MHFPISPGEAPTQPRQVGGHDEPGDHPAAGRVPHGSVPGPGPQEEALVQARLPRVCRHSPRHAV